MYIKKSAAVASTKMFKTLAYDSAKGVKHFYMQLLRAAEEMITVPDQASFNERFLNALPNDIRHEMVLCDQVSVDFTTKDLLWSAALQVDHAYDLLKAISAYKADTQTVTSNNFKNSNFAKHGASGMPTKTTTTLNNPHFANNP